ncbi:hypothetical protein ACWNX6_00555 [Candidatus Vidania fulgoroideorum]
MIYPNNLFYYKKFINSNLMIKKRDKKTFSFREYKRIVKMVKISRILGLIPFLYNKKLNNK